MMLLNKSARFALLLLAITLSLAAPLAAQNIQGFDSNTKQSVWIGSLAVLTQAEAYCRTSRIRERASNAAVGQKSHPKHFKEKVIWQITCEVAANDVSLCFII